MSLDIEQPFAMVTTCKYTRQRSTRFIHKLWEQTKHTRRRGQEEHSQWYTAYRTSTRIMRKCIQGKLEARLLHARQSWQQAERVV
jgi:hypothetical protein